MWDEKSLMPYWDDYAIRKAAREEGYQEGYREGYHEGYQAVREEIIKNILGTRRLSVAEIARITKINETFIRRVKKQFNIPSARPVRRSTNS